MIQSLAVPGKKSDIFMFRNGNRKIMQCTRIYKEWTSHKNKEVKPIELVQMNMVPKFHLKDVNWTKNGALRILATDVSN